MTNIMAAIKVLFLTLLSLGVFQHAVGMCEPVQVVACFTALTTDLGFDIRTQLPVPYISSSNLNSACEGFTDFTECLDACRSGDSANRRFSYEPHEALGEFICDTRDDYTALSTVINNQDRLTAWRECFEEDDIEGIDDDDSASTVCSNLEKFVDCVVEEAEDSNNLAAGYYFRAMAYKFLEVYDDHFNCDLDTLGAGWIIGIVFGSLAGLVLIGFVVYCVYTFSTGQSFGGGPKGPPPPPRPYGPRF